MDFRGLPPQIGDQLIFELHDLIFQRQLLLLQPPQRQLIGPTRQFQRRNRLIQIAMLALQDLEFHPKHLLKVHLAGNVHGWILVRSFLLFPRIHRFGLGMGKNLDLSHYFYAEPG